MEKEKSAAALLQEKLCYKPTQAAMKLSEEEIAQADRYCEDYKKFLDAAKTEREAVRAAVAAAEAAGFRAFDRKAPLKAGVLSSIRCCKALHSCLSLANSSALLHLRAMIPCKAGISLRGSTGRSPAGGRSLRDTW